MTMGDKEIHQDPHSAAIELSNNCRKFYFNHVRTTEEFKKSITRSRRRRASKPNGTVKSRLDAAMDKLRTEMAELMDQDISLMEQLLTLNDQIEEVKHKYMYSVSKDSLGASSCNLSIYGDLTDSDLSLASLDINDYNEDCHFGSDSDIGTNRTITSEASNSLPEIQLPVNKHNSVVKETGDEPNTDLADAFNLKLESKNVQSARKAKSQRQTSSEFGIPEKITSDLSFSDKLNLKGNAELALKVNDTKGKSADDLALFTHTFESNTQSKEKLAHRHGFDENGMPKGMISSFETRKLDPYSSLLERESSGTEQEKISVKVFINDTKNEDVENGVDKQFQTSVSKDSGFEDDLTSDLRHLSVDSEATTCADNEGATNTWNSDDSLDVEDYEDTFLS